MENERKPKKELTPEQREKKREYQRNYYASMTPGQKEIIRINNRKYQREYRAKKKREREESASS